MPYDEKTCPNCSGEGDISGNTCQMCQGSGTVPK